MPSAGSERGQHRGGRSGSRGGNGRSSYGEVKRGIEFGWRAHGAQENWTAKVDGKASLLLALQGGGLFAAASEHDKGSFLHGLTGWRHLIDIAACIGLVGAVVLTALAVIPMLGRTKTHVAAYRSHLIYFGHLRHWQAHQLAAELGSLRDSDELRMLARQLVAMSNVNWRKHRLVQASVALTIASIVGLAVVALFSGR